MSEVGEQVGTEVILLTVDELAAYLCIPRSTLYAWKYKRAGPPVIRVGRHLRYRRSDVEAWLDERTELGR